LIELFSSRLRTDFDPRAGSYSSSRIGSSSSATSPTSSKLSAPYFCATDLPGSVGPSRQLSPHDLFSFLVALLFSPSYRTEYRAEMQHDFIPIGAPHDEAVFRRLAQSGHQLVSAIAGHDQIESAAAPASSTRDAIDRSLFRTSDRLVASWDDVLRELPD
jgi:hypothetical protein